MIIEPLTTKAGAYKVALPADKSLTHRALIFAACAAGRSTIINPSPARDCKTTASVLQQLGVALTCENTRLTVASQGIKQWQSPSAPLDFGNSGTTARLMLGLLSSLPDMTCTCQGDASLSARPMGRVVRLLRQAGADIAGKNDGEYLPLTIAGQRLQARHYSLTIASAQVKSALLLAAQNITGETTITMPDGSRTHTEDMLHQQGVACHWHNRAGQQHLKVRGPYTLRPQVWHIAADPSAAAFFVVLGALLPRGMSIVLSDVLDDDNRLAYLRVVKAMGGNVERKERGAGMCELHVHGGAQLRAAQVNADDMPAVIDEVPILTVLALFAAGTTIWPAVGELRYKECDRLHASALLCQAAGRQAEERGDTLVVHGQRAPASPFTFDSQGDHRFSMAAAICALFATKPCEIKNAACVDISFPQFYPQLQKLREGC